MDTSVPTISPPELNALFGRADAPLLLDVRRRPRFDESDSLLPGARYCAPEDVAQLARSEAPQPAVVYCVYGHNVSEDAVRALRAAGWDARALAGGIEGGEPGVDEAQAVATWRSTPVLRIRKRPELGVTGGKPSRWITRTRPKIDRVACPWLIRRFIDPRAEFFYVPESQVMSQAKVLQAVPFDIEGAPISHAWERCSFDALLQAFGLEDCALDSLATIVRGADTDRLNIAPQAAGLQAISLGLSRLHLEDDHAMLSVAMHVYDALHAWCRDGRGESHRWQAHAMQEGTTQ